MDKIPCDNPAANEALAEIEENKTAIMLGHILSRYYDLSLRRL